VQVARKYSTVSKVANNIRILSTTLLEPELTALATAHGAVLDCFDFIRVDLLTDTATHHAVAKAWSESSVCIFTSANAVRAVAQIVGTTPVKASVFCISGATRRLVESTWPGVQIAGVAHDAATLSDFILVSGCQIATFFCGHSRRDVLPDRLKNGNVSLLQIPVYKTVETPVVCTEPYSAVLCYSPSGVRSFFTANAAAADTIFYAIGATTEQALRNRTSNTIRVSPVPDKKIMLEMALGIQ
jgi:uroporphyrinogen-III synthase